MQISPWRFRLTCKLSCPRTMPALMDLQHMGDIMGGTDELNLIIKVEDTANPDVLKWMDQFSEHEVEGRKHIYSASSIVSLVKEKNGGHNS